MSKIPEILQIFNKINRNYSAERMNSWIKTEDLSFIFYFFFFFNIRNIKPTGYFCDG